MKAPLPDNEEARLKALKEYGIVDTLPEQAYDDITFLASLLCEAPIALVSLVTRERQWFKSKVGLKVPETPRDVAFCSHAILEPANLTIVNDTEQDERFADNPLVTGEPGIRFYAGAPLATEEGLALGTLCVIDTIPRDLTATQRKALSALSRQVIAQLELGLRIELETRYREQLEESQRQLEVSNARLAKESQTDSLTSLANRRSFDRAFQEEIARSDRYKTPLSIIFIDVDRFKDYNDRFGHPKGDEVLQKVAIVLEQERRRGDFLARYGGEEFGVILPSTGHDGAVVLAERFRQAVEEASWEGFPITVSVGLACKQNDQQPADLIDAADRALYRAKQRGRNQVAD